MVTLFVIYPFIIFSVTLKKTTGQIKIRFLENIILNEFSFIKSLYFKTPSTQKVVSWKIDRFFASFKIFNKFNNILYSLYFISLGI